MNLIVSNGTASRASPWTRIRYQLGGGLVLAVALPYALRLLLFPDTGGTEGLANTLIASVASILLGEYFLRSIAVYPGVNAAAYAVPAFLATFALSIGAMVLLRAEYNRINLTASVVICIVWYVLVLSRAERSRRLTIAVVPLGDARQLLSVPGVSWHVLDRIGLPQEPVHAIVADLRADLPDEWERVLSEATLSGTVVYHSKQLREALTGKVRIDHLSENTFGSLMPLAAYLRIKLVLDFLAAVIALPLIALILVVVWILMRLEGGTGRFIFRQQRVGYRGRPFTMYKIRTMRDVAREDQDCDRARAITTENDPRITPLGRRLRKLRIDELPQVINILRGQMSWIGPRPEAEALSNWYISELPFYSYRHVVRPGISGWAQVNQGHVAAVDEVRDKLQNDFYYIKYFSPWLDMLIVIRTAQTVATGFGAR